MNNEEYITPTPGTEDWEYAKKVLSHYPELDPYIRSIESQALERGREMERKRIVAIVGLWVDSSDPAYAKDLFDALALSPKVASKRN